MTVFDGRKCCEKKLCKVGKDASVCWVGLCGVCQLIDASRRGSRWVSAVGLGIVRGGKSSLSLTYPMLLGQGPKKTGASG